MAKKASIKKKQPSLLATIESTKRDYVPGLSAKTGPIGGPIPTAKTGQIGPDLIGANIGKSQQLDAVEQAQMVDNMRKRSREQLAKKKLQGEVSLGPTTIQRYTEKPTGAPGEQAVDAVTKKPVKVKKKKA